MKSIRTKILVFIGGLIIVAMVIMGSFMISTVDSTVIDSESIIAKEANKLIVSNVNNYFTKYVSTVQQIARDENVINLLSSGVGNTNHLESPYFTPTYNMLINTANADEENIEAVYVASGNTDLVFDNYGWFGDETFDLLGSDFWFKNQEDIQAGYIISEPYYDDAAELIIITISAPVYGKNTDNIVGVAAIDIQISVVNDMVINAKTKYKTGYQTMITNNGVVLAHKNEDKVLNEYNAIGFSEPMIKAIENSKEELISFKDNEKSSYGVVGTADYSGWKIINIIPEKEFKEVVISTTRTIVIFFVVTLAVILFAIMITSKGIVAPLKGLTKVTNELAKGNLEVKINVNTKDEVGQLADTMRLLTLRLHDYIDYISEISDALDKFGKGNLTLHLNHTYDGEFKTIKEALLQASGTFKTTIGELIQISAQVSNGSEQVASGAQMLAQGTTEQASSIQELTATIQDISDNVSKNAKNAKNVAEQVTIVGDSTDKSNEQMNEMMEAIEMINLKSSEIGKIIKTIEDIAFQTNILALNAAVEAARAGEAGKGFAVVADEVRNLASKSAEAAKNTTVLIEDTIKAVENGTNIAGETQQVLNDVLMGIRETVELVNQISEDSIVQADSLSQTINGMDQINSVVQSNAATAEQSSAASEELSGQAISLEDISKRFNLD